MIRGAQPFKNAIIFCNRKRDVALLHKSLQKHGFNAGALHGDMDQRARMASLDAFKTGDVDLIVCSDVAARGLDIPDVSHVFNFDVPIHSEDYVHRIGRTGRAGKAGTAWTIVTPLDKKYVAEIEKLISRPIPWLDGTGFNSLLAPQDEAAMAEHVAEERPREGRGPRRPRNGRDGRNSSRPTAHREPAHREATHREPRGPRRSRAAARMSTAADQASAPRPAPHRSSYSEGEKDRPVVGMGDHTPSFLLRPVKVKPASVEEQDLKRIEAAKAKPR